MSAAHRALKLALCIACGNRLALVEFPLAARQAHLDLQVVAFEIQAERDQRVALLPNLPDQARNLLPVQQELAGADGLDIHEIGLLAWRDVAVFQPRLVSVDAHESVTKVGAAATHRLDLRPGQHDSRLELLVDEVVVVRAAVDRDVPLALGVFFRHPKAPAWRALVASPAAGTDRGRSGA